MEMPNLSDGDVISACISKDFFMKAPDESSIMKDFPENATEWIASCGKRCTDVVYRELLLLYHSMCTRKPHYIVTPHGVHILQE